MSFAPFLLSFGLNAASGIFTSLGQQQARDSEARQRNRSLLSNYRYNLAKYNQEVNYRNQVYGQQIKQYEQQVSFNNRALQDAYEGEQRRVNDVFSSIAFKNQDSLIKFAQNYGKFAATGQSGKSVDRLENAQRGALGRVQAIRQASLRNAIGEQKFNNRRFRLQAEQANAQAYAQVAVPPMFAPPPNQPTYVSSPNRLGLGIGNSLLSSLGGSVGLLPDSFFGLD
jgi:hypothetical protein